MRRLLVYPFAALAIAPFALFAAPAAADPPELSPPSIEVEVEAEVTDEPEAEKAKAEALIEAEVEVSGVGDAEAGDAATPRRVVRRRVRRLADAAREKGPWIGVAGAELPPALAAQLKLEEGVVLEDIAPESPAAKAGLKQYDILLSFAGKSLKSVAELAEAVKAAGTQEAEAIILRAGERQTFKVTPSDAPRPEAVRLPARLDADLGGALDELRKLQGEKGRMLFLGPGILPPKVAVDLGGFPGDLSVTIKKEGDQPAKITVTRGEEKWEITSEELEKLPEELRPHVEKFLGGGNWKLDRDVLRGLAPGAEQPAEEKDEDVLREVRPKQQELRFRRFDGALDGPQQEAIRKHMEELRRHMEALREQVEPPAGMKELREEVEKLRREVEKLQGGEQEAEGSKT